MELPEVSLAPAPPPCPGPAAGPGTAAPVITITAAAIAPADAPGDAQPPRTDGPGDGAGDARTDGPGDAGVTAGGGAWVTLAHWAGLWWRAASKTVTNPRGPWHAQPESLAAHDEYRRSRAWVPAGSDGKIIGPAGNAYHLTGARFGLMTGYAWAWLWARPLRITIAAVVAGGVVLAFWLG
jgi:hypothetical protein